MKEQALSSSPGAEPMLVRPGIPVFVDIIARTNPDGGVEWSHDWRWDEDGSSKGKGAIIIPKREKKDPGTRMHFMLKDQTDPKRHFVFFDNKGAALWVMRDCCPPADVRSDDTEFPADEFVSARHQLTALNRNSDACTLHYRLWFKDKAGEIESYDPAIINGGKGRR
ncbi:MAG: hypothetical protein ABIS38_07870 [Sphingomicrobium sp.]